MATSVEMRAVHTVASLRADHGGPARSITALCSALADRGLQTELVAVGQRPGEEAPLLPKSDRVSVRLVGGATSRTPLREFEGALMALLRSSPRPSVVHDHGIWLGTNHAAARSAGRTALPYVVSPRGMLSSWALDFHKWKKKLAWLLYQRADLRSAKLLHVTSEQEAREVRALGLRQPLAIIANGVTVPPTARSRAPRAGKNALFLSRVHPKKGVLNLIAAWAQVRPPGWSLTIAGPDDGGHRAVAEALAQREGVGDEVEFVGSVPDDAKWSAYANADLFVLPTFSENFGIVIAEALGSGVPVITTKAAPWRGLDEHRCGWWIDIGVEPLARALREATSVDEAQRHIMGERGRAYVDTTFSWKRIASEMREAYHWTLFGGSVPRHVIRD